MLTFLSTRIGGLAGRIGGRPFLVAGPLINAVGLLWLARIPTSSQPWTTGIIPPVDTLVDVLPGILLFGLGMSMVVAPLTSTLMNSVPTRNAGLASAINNAISRVGQPLLAAVIFIVVTASFYSSLAASVPGLDPNDPTLRATIQPLNKPPAGTPPAVVAAANEASTDAFHLAVLVSAALMAAGAAVNFVGLRSGPNLAPATESSAEPVPAESGAPAG
jgi:hypothetical protein